MCGLTGFWQSGGSSQSLSSLRSVAGRMADALRHRGPDDAGTWADVVCGVALGHRRLAILDLSPAGHQPMTSARGRYVMGFNGEIYNHLELRRELQVSLDSRLRGTDAYAQRSGTNESFCAERSAVAESTVPSGTSEHGSCDYAQYNAFAWRGHSDTETLLAGFEHWGVEATLKRCVGMFAIALWDKQTRTLTLARDRFGEKPLYYGWVGQSAERAFVFGSELKALKVYPGFDAPVCREALAQYMRFMYVPAPLSIYEGIYKLEPGYLLTLDSHCERSEAIHDPELHGLPRACGPRNDTLKIQRWWSLADAVQAGAREPITDEVEALRLLEAQLGEAVRLQSLADVPLGAFLSGGVDSSTIVALMQQQAKLDGSAPTKTFTIGFDEAGFDESPHARAVAQHLGTEHHEMRVSARMAQDVIPILPQMHDEPFADSSQIPTYLVSKAARQHVTVALSGDSGDELFGGYNRYFWGPRIWKRLARIPHPVRKALGSAINAVPVPAWDALGAPLNGLLPGTQGIARLGDKAHKLAARLRNVRNMDDLYVSLVTEWQDPGSVVKSGRVEAVLSGDAVLARPTELASPCAQSQGPGFQEPPPGLTPVERMMYLDAMTYLPDDILCKVDRAAMASSLETRVPFLDYRVAELAWRLPMSMKIRGNTGKWALRQVLYKHVPRELIERPKAGFAIPLGQWLRGPLRDWAEALLDENRLRAEGYFYPGPIRQRWAEHVSGRRDHTTSLWAVLMFQVWLESVN